MFKLTGFSGQPYEVDTSIIISLSEMRKLRLRKVVRLKSQSQDNRREVNPDSKTSFSSTTLSMPQMLTLLSY